MLSASDLAYMRGLQNQAMPGTVVIERYTLTSDGAGGYTETWTAAGTVTGRIYPRRMQGEERITGGQVVSETDWFATLPVGTVIDARDRLLYDNRTWEVVRVNNSEMYITAIRCELQSHNEERRD